MGLRTFSRRSVAILATTSTLLLSSINAQAGFASAYASIDFGSLIVTPISGAITFTTPEGDDLSTFTDLSGLTTVSNPQGTTDVLEQNETFANAKSEVIGYSEMSSQALSAGDYARSEVNRFGSFEITTGGIIMFQVNASAVVGYTGTDDSYAKAESNILIEYDDPTKNFITGSTLTGEIDSAFDSEDLFQLDEVITLLVLFESGDSGTIYANTYAEAFSASPVPLPASFLLLGSGLIGLMSLKRKIQA